MNLWKVLCFDLGWFGSERVAVIVGYLISVFVSVTVVRRNCSGVM